MSRTAAVIDLAISVEANGEISREALAKTMGAWVERLPADCLTIHTVNDKDEAVTITVRCAVGAK